MKLDASATTPGFANRFQNGTEPSAKSSQTGVCDGSTQLACTCCAGAPCPPASERATAATTRTPSLFTLPYISREAGLCPASLTNALRLVFVERRIHFGDLLGLDVALARAATVLDPGLPAEIKAQRVEVDPVAAVGVDLFERGEQLLLRLRPHVRGGG